MDKDREYHDMGLTRCYSTALLYLYSYNLDHKIEVSLQKPVIL